MKERIKEIQETTGMTQSDFAHHIGLSPAALSSIYGGRTNPTLKTVECIQSKFPTYRLVHSRTHKQHSTSMIHKIHRKIPPKNSQNQCPFKQV